MTNDREAAASASRAESAAQQAASSAELAEDAASAADAAAADVEQAVTDDLPLGEQGAPFEKRNPFYFGFVAGFGALLAWFLFDALTGIGSTLLLVVVSLFLAAGLNPAVEFLQRHGLKRGFAVLAVIVAFLGAVALFVLAIVPVITDQVRALTDNVPMWLDDLQRNKRVQEFNEQYDVIDKAKEYVAEGDFVGTLFGGAIGIGLAVLGALFNAFIIIVLTLYFLSSLDNTKRAFYSLAPASRRDRVAKLGDRIIRSVGGYVSGAFIVAMCAGITSLIFLFAVGLGEYAVALAFVVALLDVIPMIGATLGAIVVSAIGFATDWKIGVACVIFYVIYQQFENYVIYPRVMNKSVDVPGAVVVIAALVGTGLLGIVGALLAIPTASAVLLIMREVVVKRQDQR